MRVRLHHVFVVAGLLAGTVAGALLIAPLVFGVLLGAGAGLAGGAFIAAIISGEQLASGGSSSGTRTRRRQVNPALRHFEVSAPPSTNGKHEHNPSETEDASRDRLN
jgi:hypothetical protein